MKNIRANLFIYSFAFFTLLLSCAKEKSCEGCRDSNKPPIALTGPDQVISLPTDSTALDGSASNDPDGTINEWLWKKISGPGSFNIENDTLAKTIVRKLDTGVYQFELVVKDDGGLIAKDTIQVTVHAQVQINRPPVAHAGPDQTISLPTNTLTLNGSGSVDPDNNITTYFWTKISGPTSGAITNPNATQTGVTNLTAGRYLFALTVTDAGGLFSSDTVHVDVKSATTDISCTSNDRPIVSAQLVPFATLNQELWTITSTGNKLIFTGSNSIDIYDVNLNAWSQVDMKLSVPREGIAVVATGDKIIFAGGDDGLIHRTVDIYDMSTNSWTVSQLSRQGDSFSAAICGDKVFFTGGNQGVHVTNVVDIYNLTTNSWSTASLSSPRNYITAVASKNKVFFTGGDPWAPGTLSNAIDIYDKATDSWSTSTMQTARSYHAGVVVNDILYLAGGVSISGSASCSVETWNTITGDRSSMNLFAPAIWAPYAGRNAVLKNNQIILLRHNGGADANRFDIYDISSNSWSVGILPFPIPSSVKVFSLNNTIYVGGGLGNNQVWKLEY